MTLPIYIVDAFTDKAFAGNPAAVCVLPEPGDEAWMQNVAREMNLAETAFLVPQDEPGRYGLRWFTPTVEVPLCGHATLASAHALWSNGIVDRGMTLGFDTASGMLSAGRIGDLIELNFPMRDQHAAVAPMEVTVALGAQPIYTGRNESFLLCEFKSEEEVRSLAPDFPNLAKIAGIREFVATSRSDDGADYDFVSRMFAPAIGIDEDPVTGATHCMLAPYWASRLGRTELTGYQASARGGYVQVAVDGERVKLRGKAVTILKGELLIRE